MRIRVTDPGSRNANQNVRRSNLGNWNVRRLERFSDLDESHGSHDQSAFVLSSGQGFSVYAKHRMKSLWGTFPKEVLEIRYKTGVEYFLRVRPPLLCALARQNGEMRTLEPIDDLGVNNAEIALEINAFESSKSHDEPEMQPCSLFFSEAVAAGIG